LCLLHAATAAATNASLLSSLPPHLLPLLPLLPPPLLPPLPLAAATQVLEQLGTEGVLILEVPAGTPAAAAGLRPTYRDVFGDIVLGDIVVGESPHHSWGHKGFDAEWGEGWQL
jgi:hypothetical protein